jgi:phosphate acyltransferase
MGGDMGPAEVVEAVKLALADSAMDPITLVGDEAVLRPLIVASALAGNDRLAVVHASEVITMEDKPLQALKRKKDSSMVRAIDLVKSGEARVTISCGNTGALMAGSTLRLRMMEGIDLPSPRSSRVITVTLFSSMPVPIPRPNPSTSYTTPSSAPTMRRSSSVLPRPESAS